MMNYKTENECVQCDATETALEKAQLHDRRARELDVMLQSTWSELGLLALTVDENREWQLLGFHSFGSWLMAACPKSRSVVYAAMGALRELSDVPAADLAEISHSTAHTLKKLPKAMRAKREVLEAAKKLTTKEFVRKIKREAPELHLEEYVKREFSFSESQEEVIDHALELAGMVYELSDDESKLEVICTEWSVQTLAEQRRRGPNESVQPQGGERFA